ncbi:hypothetical protein [Cellulomonas sp. HZM]|uniref:hypothetical protein n=1 Tax=Cellulomonas sp. HZM TaxID=1454010 RepID=UPI0004939D03|nr:hypothetical protein [Cellulomonas sp. HZM]
MTDDDKVENRYRTALSGATPGARTQASAAGSAFATTLSALANDAWVSTTADAFSSTCTSKQSSAGDAAQDCVDEMTSRHSREPAKVDKTDYRARWH